jgi:hypothetical protein
MTMGQNIERKKRRDDLVGVVFEGKRNVCLQNWTMENPMIVGVSVFHPFLDISLHLNILILVHSNILTFTLVRETHTDQTDIIFPIDFHWSWF